jgi:hypothetical protein
VVPTIVTTTEVPVAGWVPEVVTGAVVAVVTVATVPPTVVPGEARVVVPPPVLVVVSPPGATVVVAVPESPPQAASARIKTKPAGRIHPSR